jgi:hypothetical protein
MPIAFWVVVAVSSAIALVAGMVVGYRRSLEEIERLARDVVERDVVIDALADELYLLHENPREVRRRYEAAVAAGCSFKGDYGRIVDPATLDGEVA